ncbi:MAG: EthD family reductase [Acidimicrobiales bacterium]
MATAARFLVLWSQPHDPASFERHYREVHIPLALEIPGLRRYTLSRNIAPIRGEDPPYLVAGPRPVEV